MAEKNWREYFPDKLADFFSDFYNKHYSEIPADRINSIDWLGYGWPRLDHYGDLVGIGGTESAEPGFIDVIVEDENGGEWIVACEELSGIPSGLTPTKWYLYDNNISDISELFEE